MSLVHDTVSANKSLTLIGSPSLAFVSCGYRLKFESRFASEVTLTRLAFVNSSLTFEYTEHSSTTISDSRFTDNKVALEFSSNSTHGRNFVFIRNTFFGNNAKCLKVTSIPRFYFEISETAFVGNGDKQSSMSSTDLPWGLPGILNFVNWPMNGFGSGWKMVNISNSIFLENHGPRVLLLYSDQSESGTLNVTNSSFISNRNVLVVTDGFKIFLSNVTLNYSSGNALQVISATQHNLTYFVSANLHLRKCVFGYNKASLLLHITRTPRTNITVEDTIFIGQHPKAKKSGVALLVQIDFPKVRPDHRSTASLLFNGVQVSFMVNTAFSVVVSGDGSSLVHVKNSTFLNNTNLKFFSYQGHGAIYISTPREEADVADSLGKTLSRTQKHQVLIEGSRFKGNGGYRGALYIRRGSINFVNCIFQDNFAIRRGGYIYMPRKNNGNFTIRNTTFLETGQAKDLVKQKNFYSGFVYLYNSGCVNISGSFFRSDVNRGLLPIFAIENSPCLAMDPSSSLKCPIGSSLILENLTHYVESLLPMTVTDVKYYCQECPQGFYSLIRGSSSGLKIHEQTKCIPCPYGASCLPNIKANRNFWGYVTPDSTPPTLTFSPCPLEYCLPPQPPANLLNYNGCFGKRTGVLCGRCSSGFSEALFSTKCQEESKCHGHWFWPITTVYTMLFALYLILKPPVVSFLWKKAFWFKRRTPEANSQPLEAPFDPGYLKIVFYYYQIAELLIITDLEEPIHQLYLVLPVVGLFNFQIRSMYGRMGCPFPGLTAVTKELFLCLKVFATMGWAFVFYGIHTGISKTGKFQRPSLTRYLAVVMEVMLLGYERIADASLSLLHCVPIASTRRLFLDGSVVCFQWWQNILIAYIVMFVAPFIVVLYFGSLRLFREKLSVKEFLGACTLPLPFLVYWTVRHVKKGNAREAQFCDHGHEVKAILHESYRRPTETGTGAMYWESVLIARRLILLSLHSFISDPLVRLLCMGGACIAILAHHLLKKPYRDTKANTCETMSLLAIVAIATLNVAFAALMSAGVEPCGPNKSFFQGVQWIEIALLGILPGAFGAVVMFAALSLMVRLIWSAFLKVSVVMRQMIESDSNERQSLLEPLIGD